jgi:hypothetical protein
VLTDAEGRAAANGLKTNGVKGDLNIQVTASHRGVSASTVITQTNLAAVATTMATAKLITILAIAGSAAAAGIAVAATGGPAPQATQPPPITLTPGSPSIGPPQ